MKKEITVIFSAEMVTVLVVPVISLACFTSYTIAGTGPLINGSLFGNESSVNGR